MPHGRASILLLLLAASISPPTAGHTLPGHGGATCGGTAPADTLCTTGEHLNTWLQSVHLDFLVLAASHSFTGTLEATVTPALPFSAPATLRCDFVAGAEMGCTGPSIASIVGPFVHACKASELGTTRTGGSGAWDCWVYHSAA